MASGVDKEIPVVALVETPEARAQTRDEAARSSCFQLLLVLLLVRPMLPILLVFESWATVARQNEAG